MNRNERLRAQRRRVNVERLRREHPSWTWSARQLGFGYWNYYGFREYDGARVRVTCCGDVDEFDDVCSIHWCVYDEQGRSCGYESWNGGRPHCPCGDTATIYLPKLGRYACDTCTVPRDATQVPIGAGWDPASRLRADFDWR